MAKDKAKGLGEAAVKLFDIALEDEVVGQIELADTGGIAAAAEILQKQCVIELPQLAVAQPHFSADVNADPAAAHAMAGGLSLNEIQRVTESA
jgi:hypothetical protein